MTKRESRRLWGTVLLIFGTIQIINFAVRDINAFPIFHLDFVERGIFPVFFANLNWPFKVMNYFLYIGLGWTAFLLPLFLIALAVTLFNKKETKRIKFRRLSIIWGVGELMLLVYLANFLSFVIVSPSIQAGILADLFARYLQKVGGSSFLIVFFLYSFISYLLFVTNSTWRLLFARLGIKAKNSAKDFGNIIANNLSTKELRDERQIRQKKRELKAEARKKPKRIAQRKTKFVSAADEFDDLELDREDPPAEVRDKQGKTEAPGKEEAVDAEYEVINIKEFDSTETKGSFAFESLFFNSTEEEAEEFIAEMAKQLLANFSSWGIQLKNPHIVKGPHLLRFDFEIPRNIQLKQIEKYREELSYRMGGRKIDLELPIKGTDRFGVYIERENPDKLGLREYLSEIGDSKHAVPFLVGVQADGKAVWRDAAKFPHLLIAGSTGSGKSVFLNTVVLNLLALSDIKPVNLILIDPKRVEFSPFTGIPQLATPIVTDVQEAANVLRDAEEVMEQRYHRVTKMKVRNIEEYNQVSSDPMPYLFIIVDELSDLLMQDSTKTIKASLIRLAQKSRAVGIHLIVATQRPSSDIIDGLIKSNFPARIAFKTSGKVDSRIILDEGGAENLLGNGDMMEKTVAGERNRLQGVFVSIGEIQKIVNGLG
jgi:S-DNA-T family DNA segregation ATPase FtsK/SpoIIIE